MRVHYCLFFACMSLYSRDEDTLASSGLFLVVVLSLAANPREAQKPVTS